MAKRRIHIVEHDNRAVHIQVKVYWDSEWQEYSCMLVVNKAIDFKATYYTDNRLDAICTAKAMLDRSVRMYGK